jgi:hypothetical protein
VDDNDMSQLADLHVQLVELEQSIGTLLDTRPYAIAPEQRNEYLLALFKRELEYACESSSRFSNYVRHWPVSLVGSCWMRRHPGG